ncbi:nicastrin-like, partial [Oppia nitens]|uniref:nicastrin-like n=1 Tax=Oppia nitens TaxID=1686743 RepID=UPI0023DA29C8
IRRFNLTHQIGCSSHESGNVGAVHIIKNDSDIDFVIKFGKHSPYIVVMTAKHFNFKTFDLLKQNANRLTGILILDNKTVDSQLGYHSFDRSCPNEYHDLYVNDGNYSHCSTIRWNRMDNDNHNHNNNHNLMFNDWPFPVFLIKNQTNITAIYNCSEKYGTGWPVCAIELKSAMFGAKDGPTCIRKTYIGNNPIKIFKKNLFCSPETVLNLFSSLESIDQKTSSNNKSIADMKSVVLVASRFDTLSLFANSAGSVGGTGAAGAGADSVLTSLITMLSIVHTLNDALNNKNSIISDEDKISRQKMTKPTTTTTTTAMKRTVVFAIFDGESLDYIGSSRTVYDMSLNNNNIDSKLDSNSIFGLRSKQLSHFIELSQLAMHSTNNNSNNTTADPKQTIYIHKNVYSTDDGLMNQLIDLIKSNADQLDDMVVESVIDGQPLPPSSLQSFLKQNLSSSLVGVVLANHQREYSNKFYNSIYDDFHRLNKSDRNLVKHLTQISTIIYNKKSMTKMNMNNQLGKDYYYLSKNSLITTVFELLSYFSSENIANITNEDDCKPSNSIEKTEFKYKWIPGPDFNGTCIRYSRNRIWAEKTVSPPFIGVADSLKIGQNSDHYSSWTQSHYDRRLISVRLFLMSSPTIQCHQLLSLIDENSVSDETLNNSDD